MLGNLIARIRKEKEITKTQLANSTGINVGHLTHIEKNTRICYDILAFLICNKMRETL